MSKPGDESPVGLVRVSADGTNWVDVSAPLQSLDVEDNDRLTDKVVVVFDDNTGLLADASFKGLRVRIGIGWQAEHAYVFEGVVTAVRVLAQPGGQRVELTALDLSYFLTLRPYDPTRWAAGAKLSAVITGIVTDAKCGINALDVRPALDVTMSEKRPVGSAGRNEWEFVLDQARRQGCIAFVEFDGKDTSKLFFVPLSSAAAAEPIGTLRYCRGAGELIEFHYEKVGSGAVPVLTAGSIDPDSGEAVTPPDTTPPPPPPVPPPGTGRRGDIDADLRKAVAALTQLTAAAAAKVEPRRDQVSGQPAASAADLAARTKPDPTRILGLNGQGVSVGTVKLRAKSTVTIQGIAPWAEGVWYVTKVNHRYSRERSGNGTRSSYFSTFTATR